MANPNAIDNPDYDWFGANNPVGPASNLSFSPTGAQTSAPSGMTRTGTMPTGPNGVPDPNHPGYDTNGWLLGAKVNTDGTVSTPNPLSGQTATTTPSTLATSQAATPPPPPAVDKFPTAASLSAIYGNMPTIPNVPAFSAPSGSAVLNADPGFAFRESQGEDALRYAASAGGLANTTGTLQDLIKFNQNFASGEYQNAFDRALGVYNTNLQTQYELPYAAAWQQYMQGVNNFNTNQAQATDSTSR